MGLAATFEYQRDYRNKNISFFNDVPWEDGLDSVSLIKNLIN